MESIKVQEEINNLTFSVFSSDNVRKLAVCDISNPKDSGEGTVFDERMGGADMGLDCITCKKSNMDCAGHFGKIELQLPVIHPLYTKEVLKYLQCFCFTCSRLVIPRETLALVPFKNPAKRIAVIVEKCKKLSSCWYCYQERFENEKESSTEEETEEEDEEEKPVNFEAGHPTFVLTKEKEFVACWTIKKQTHKRVIGVQKIQSIFESISNQDIEILGIDPTLVHPKYFIINALPVIPVRCRPCVKSDDGSIYDDDLSKRYIEIVKVNNRIRVMLEKKKAEKREIVIENDEKLLKAYNSLKRDINVLIDNTTLQVKYTNKRVIACLKKRLTGKDGRIRSNIMGKRCNFTARTVAGPDPTLNIDEIALPYKCAESLTYPEIVNDLNRKELLNLILTNKANFLIKKNGTKINLEYAIFRKNNEPQPGDFLIRKGKTTVVANPKSYVYQKGDKIRKKKYFFKLENGDVVERHLKDGDIVLLNRQPTLHRGSLLSMKVKLRPGFTIRTNLAITSSFNLDYDGDELNIHVPQNVLARVEANSLGGVRNNLTNVQDGKPIPNFIQDALLGLFLLTSDEAVLTKEDAFQLFMCVSQDNFQDIDLYLEKLSKFEEKNISDMITVSGKNVLSVLFPEHFYFSLPSILIQHGRIQNGSISKANLSKILFSLFSNYSRDIAIDFINKSQFMANNYLLICGFSVGYRDCLLSQDKVSEIQDKIHLYFEEAEMYEQKLEKYDFIRESRISNSLHKAKDTSQRIAKENMHSNNNFNKMISSGSKGNYSNISQITGALGQQNLMGKRIGCTLSENTRTLSCFPVSFSGNSKENIHLKYQSRGFILSSFFKGLDPIESFFHAASSREGITDTACKTAESGYLQRKIVKMLEDVKIAYDGTVRNSRNTVVQFNYGRDSIDGAHINVKQEFCNISEIANRLNSEFEMAKA